MGETAGVAGKARGKSAIATRRRMALHLRSSVLQAEFDGALRLFQEGQFWVSHEGWEHVWMNMRRSSGKVAVQAFIQSAAALVLLEQGRIKGFIRKRAQAMDKFEGLAFLGVVKVAGLSLEAMQHLLDEAESLIPSEQGRVSSQTLLELVKRNLNCPALREA